MGIVALILSVGLLIPVIQSSASTVLSNGDQDGLRFDNVEGGQVGAVYFSDYDGNSFVITYADGSSDSVTVEPMILFSFSGLAVFINESNQLQIIAPKNGAPYSSISTRNIGELSSVVYEGRNVTIHWGDGNSTTYEDVFWNSAYVPSGTGNYGFYSEGGLYFRDSDRVVGVTSYEGSKGYATAGGTFRGEIYTGLSGGDLYLVEPIVTYDGDKLQSIVWNKPGAVEEEVTPIEPISRESLVELGNAIGTATVYSNGTGSGATDTANVTFFDNGKCQINSYTNGGDNAPRFGSSIAWNGGTYDVAVIGDGQNPVISSGTEFNVSNWDRVELINDFAFYNVAPSSFSMNYYPIVIGNSAFEGFNYSNSYSLSLGYYYKWIGDNAFKNCNAFTWLNLDALQHIGDSAFEGCISLSSCTTEEGVTPGIYYVGDNAFKGCSGFNGSLLFGNEWTPVLMANIGNSAFEGCVNLFTEWDSITINPRITSIGNRAFANTGAISEIYLNTESTFGSDMFVGSTITTVYVTGGAIPTTSNVGAGITVIAETDTVESVGYIAPINIYLKKTGIIYEMLELLPLFVLLGVAVGIAIEVVRRK